MQKLPCPRRERRALPGDGDAPIAGTGHARLVVVGGGMVAQQLVERMTDGEASSPWELTLLCEELVPPYDRVHLGSVLEGDAAESLMLRTPSWYADRGISLQLKQRVLAVDRENRRVRTDAGAELEYDRLVLATGGEPWRPPIPGIELDGVVPYRTLEDVDQISQRATEGQRVTVLGGGLLGLEAARALQKRGCDVQVIEAAPRLLPRQLDIDGAHVLEDQIRALGIPIRMLTRVEEITETREGTLRLRLNEGITQADLVVVAAGIRPRDALARAAGLECHRGGGVIVDDGLATSDPSIFAIGECARHRDTLYGFVAPCYEMAEVLADRLANGDRRFTGSVSSARLKIDEVDVVAVGESLAEGPDVSALAWVAKDQYRRVVLENGRIIGAIAVGAGSDFPHLQRAVARQERVRAWNKRRFEQSGNLWRNRAQQPITEWPDNAVLCTCTGVTCGNLRAARERGCRTRLALAEATGASTVCGTCSPLLAELAGEQLDARRTSAGRALGIAAALGLAALAGAGLAGPFPLATSVVTGAKLDFLWRDEWWKQATGFSLVGLSLASLLFSLRKRWPRFALGSFGGWRALHTALGVGTIVALGVHTGFRSGANLNFALMVCFTGVVLLGSFAALATSLEHRLPPTYAGALRRGWTAAHVFVVWPLPVLVLFHVLAVYFY